VGIETCAEIPPVCVDRVEAHVGVEQKSNIKVTGQFDGTVHKEQTIDTLQFDPIVFFIGPVPVVIVPTIDVVVGLDGEAHANFVFAANASSTLKLGAKWTDPDDGGSGWQDINEFTPLQGGVTESGLNANLKVEGYGKANAKLLLYDVAGPGMAGSIGLGAEVRLGQKPLWTIYGHIVADVNFSVDIAAIIDLGNYSHRVLDESFQIGQAANQAPQCNHVTDVITAEIGVPITLGPRSGFEGYFECTDPEGDVPSYSAISSRTTDGLNGAIPLRYAFQSGGLRLITVTARDADGGSVNFVLRVDVHNSLPIVTISPNGGTVPASVLFPISAEAFDPDTNKFLTCDRLQWDALPDIVLVKNRDGGCNAEVRFSQEGVHTVTVSATDLFGGVGTQSITVNVTSRPDNLPPELNLDTLKILAETRPPGSGQPCELLGFLHCLIPENSYLWDGSGARMSDEYQTPLYMTVTATDPEGAPVSYDWQCMTGTQPALVVSLGDNTYKCTPIYATANGVPIPVDVSVAAFDGVSWSARKIIHYFYRARVN